MEWCALSCEALHSVLHGADFALSKKQGWVWVSAGSHWLKAVLQGANRKLPTKLGSKGSLSPAPSWPGLQQLGLLHKSGGRSDGATPDQPPHSELLNLHLALSCLLIQPEPSCAYLGCLLPC